MRTTDILRQNRRRSKSETPASTASNRSTRNPPPRPTRGPHLADDSEPHANRGRPATRGLPRHAILDNMVPDLEIPGTEEGFTINQLTSILTRNAKNFAEDSVNKTCSRAGCSAPDVCFLQREREQREHALLYRYLKCIQVPQPRKNLLSKTRRQK